jgi:hypothetical protein
MSNCWVPMLESIKNSPDFIGLNPQIGGVMRIFDI